MAVRTERERAEIERLVAARLSSARTVIEHALALLEEGKGQEAVAEVLKKGLAGPGFRAQPRRRPEAIAKKPKNPPAIRSLRKQAATGCSETTAASDFERDLDYILEKNAELYRRLAR